MTIEYSPELVRYMKEKRKQNILVEVAASNNSEFQVQELVLRFLDDKHARYFLEKRRFGSLDAPYGKLLLPPYHLVYQPVLRFSLKKILFFPSIRQEGISF
ncbi:MAG: hypothetical protein ACOX8B_05350 [Lachnospiraceae bacterium]|jgi:hypothetical protein